MLTLYQCIILTNHQVVRIHIIDHIQYILYHYMEY